MSQLHVSSEKNNKPREYSKTVLVLSHVAFDLKRINSDAMKTITDSCEMSMAGFE